MSRFRLVLLSMLAVFAFAAVASASASAHRFIGPSCFEPATGNPANLKWTTAQKCLEKTPAGGEASGKWEWEEIASGTKVTGTSGLSILESEIGKEKITIECEEDAFSGTLEASGKSKGTIEFKKNCKVAKPAGCGVEEPIVASFEDQLTSTPEDEFTGTLGAGEEFAKLTLTTCALKGTYAVKGKQLCKLDSTYATLQAEHELICEKTGSKLKLGTKTASFSSTAKIKLVGGGNWAIE